MIRRNLRRLARMDAAEFRWRVTTGGRAMIDRAATGLVTPRWKRELLLPALALVPDLRPARAALSRHGWAEAHRELSRYFTDRPQRFVAGQTTKEALIARIGARFPDSGPQAGARADRILAGEYDLLGYCGLRFDPIGDCGSPERSDAAPHPSDRLAVDVVDWHFDPVHDRRAPRTAWSAVPYLETACGDHKIIWEINRHQHWLRLGRAYWLTGDSKYRDRFVAELTSWIGANPPLIGINWASMLELAFRSLSWLWAFAFFVEDAGDGAAGKRTDDPTPWTVDLLLALDRQLTHIERHLSHYFSPNTHLIGEALALYVSGLVLPELSASARRVEIGRRILLAEIARQIAPDGGHCERSTHYHRYTLDFYLLALIVARINGDPAAGELERAVSRLAAAARLLADDHGRVPHIGDDDGGMLMPMTERSPDDLRDGLAVAAVVVDRPLLRVGPIPEEALWLLGHDTFTTRLESAIAAPEAGGGPLRSGALADTGYYVSRSPASDHLIIDGGPHGYQNGGHAHADALSLTFSVRGVPLLIDPGTGCYTADAVLRDRFRSTALHNTLTLDDRPQSVSSGPFHWSHTADSRVRRWRRHERFDYFEGGHDGYRPLVHRRSVLALHGDLLIVADVVDGPGTHTAATHWQIDPQWTTGIVGRRATFARNGARISMVVPEGSIERFSADAATGLGWHSPVYGRVERATTLRVTRRGTTPLWMVSVFDLREENPVADVDWLPVWSEAGAPSHAIGVRISRAVSTDYLLIAEPNGAAASGVTTTLTCRNQDVETDARMLFYRTMPAGGVSHVALVDGSMARTPGGTGFQLDLRNTVAEYFAELAFKRPTKDQGPRTDQGPGTDHGPRPKDQGPICVALRAS